MSWICSMMVMACCSGRTSFSWRVIHPEGCVCVPSWASRALVSALVYLGIKEVSRTSRGAASHCRVVCWATWSAKLLPWAILSQAAWCPRQCKMATSFGRGMASSSLVIWEALHIGEPLVVRKPLSFQIATCEWAIRKAYLESV